MVFKRYTYLLLYLESQNETDDNFTKTIQIFFFFKFGLYSCILYALIKICLFEPINYLRNVLNVFGSESIFLDSMSIKRQFLQKKTKATLYLQLFQLSTQPHGYFIAFLEIMELDEKVQEGASKGHLNEKKNLPNNFHKINKTSAIVPDLGITTQL